MTGREFRRALRSNGISQLDLSKALGVAHSTVNRWATGDLPVPGYIDFILSLLERNAELRAQLDKTVTAEEVLG